MFPVVSVLLFTGGGEGWSILDLTRPSLQDHELPDLPPIMSHLTEFPNHEPPEPIPTSGPEPPNLVPDQKPPDLLPDICSALHSRCRGGIKNKVLGLWLDVVY